MSVPSVMVEISPGELIDRLTILELKLARIADPAKLANVRREHATLVAVHDDAVPSSSALTALRAELADVNGKLWDVEDSVRACERAQDFGADFVALARSVYQLNDQRGRIKRDIDILLGARFHEEKSHDLPEAEG